MIETKGFIRIGSQCLLRADGHAAIEQEPAPL